MATDILEVYGPPQAWLCTEEGLQESTKGSKVLTMGCNGGQSTGLERKWTGQWAGQKLIRGADENYSVHHVRRLN